MNHFLLGSLLLGTLPIANCVAKDKQPNIVLILCDDMGFSDLGSYGSEIQTPHIDRLAEMGIRFSQFKNTGRSCPSRAALLTGRHQHESGLGWMTAVDEHRPGYRGQINPEYPTIAEILKANGYRTYMSGKWHVTVDGAFNEPNGSYPAQRGFDRYYGCLHGGGSYYKPEPLYSNLRRIKDIPDDYYYTNAITDSAVHFIQEHPEGKPMFLYLAHYAPHLPLQAPKAAVDKCKERYRVGYDVLRKARFEKQKQLGLIPQDADYPTFNKEFNGKRPAWTELSKQQQEQWIQSMATYAAMIEIMDEGIGKVIQTIQEKGMMENTVFLFLSDNGATEEGGFIGQLMSDLSNTPYRSYKKWCFQGGTSTPFILTFGDEKKNPAKGSICRQPAHIIDIIPTCMELANARYPKSFKHKDLPGIDLMPIIKDKTRTTERTLYFEHQGSCAIIDNNWKLVKANRNVHWELYDLSQDPFETNDLAKENPQTVEKLETMWVDWAQTHKVFPLEDKEWNKRIQFYLDKNADQDGID